MRHSLVLRAGLLLGLVLPATAAGSPALWRWSVEAVGRIVEGDATAAVGLLRRARAARDLPELDALVGLAALRGGERVAAWRRLEAAAGRRAEEALVYYWAGRLLLLRGQRAAALRRFEQALAVGGDRPALRMAHAIVLLAAGQQERALASLQAVAARTPDLLDPSLYPTASEGAIELLEPLLRGFPDRVELLRTEAHLYWRASRPLAAQRSLRALLQARADDPDGLQMLARTQLALGETAAANASLERALRLAPELPQARAARGELLLDRGEAARAIEDLRAAADALPRDARLLGRLAEACAAAERADCARQFYAHAVRRDPRLAVAHFGLGLLEQQAGRTAAARQHLRRALALQPNSARFLEGAAHLEAAQGQQALARRQLAEAARVGRTEKEQQRRLGLAGEEARRQRTALRELGSSPRCETPACRQAVAQAPQPARLFLQAHLRLGRGDAAGARQHLAELLPRINVGLLIADPTVLETAGQAGGRAYRLRAILPLVPASRFR